MQIFASSPGAWRPPLLDSARLSAFLEARKQHGVDPVFIHAIYLINLASDDEVLVGRAMTSLIATLEAAEVIGATGVVTDIGSHGGRALWSTPMTRKPRAAAGRTDTRTLEMAISISTASLT